MATATERQVALIRTLAEERTLADDLRERLGQVLTRRLEMGQASKIIEWLLRQPPLAGQGAQSEPLPEVPEGRYAIETDDGPLAFYRVDRPDEGRWAGYVFLNVQASDDWHPVKGRAAKATILARIAEDPRAASERYGLELGECGICGRTLTDEESRRRGIGPICARRHGWL